jgi:hypothetical protein
MFDSYKKSISPFQLAVYISLSSADHMVDVEKKVSESLEHTSGLTLSQGKTVDEMQWVPVACGVIAARICFGVEAAQNIIRELGVVYAGIHETNRQKGRRTPFTEEFISALQAKVSAYLRAFEGGLGLNAVRVKGADPVELALKRVAAVGHDLVRGLPLADIATSELPDGPLSRVVYDLARQSTQTFRSHFDQFRLS